MTLYMICLRLSQTLILNLPPSHHVAQLLTEAKLVTLLYKRLPQDMYPGVSTYTIKQMNLGLGKQMFL